MGGFPRSKVFHRQDDFNPTGGYKVIWSPAAPAIWSSELFACVCAFVADPGSQPFATVGLPWDAHRAEPDCG